MNLDAALSPTQSSRWSALLDELKLVAPVIGVWALIWVPLVMIRDPGDYRATRENLVGAFSATAMVMTILWCCLYGKFGIWRIVAGLVVIASSAWLGMMLSSLGSGDNALAKSYQTIVFITFISSLGFIPGWCVRRFLRWQIARPEELDFTHDRRIRISDIFAWTAAAAFLFAMFPMFVESWFSGEQEDRESVTRIIAYMVAIGVIIPALTTLIYFSLLAAYRPSVVAVAIPVLAIASSLVVTVVAWQLRVGPDSFAEVWESFFWLATTLYSVAGFLFLSAVVWLRRQGLYFKVGLIDHRAALTKSAVEH